MATRTRRLVVASVLAASMALSLPLATVPVEAGGKKRGGDGQAVLCDYLLRVYNDTSLSLFIRNAAGYAYNFYCVPPRDPLPPLT